MPDVIRFCEFLVQLVPKAFEEFRTCSVVDVLQLIWVLKVIKDGDACQCSVLLYRYLEGVSVCLDSSCYREESLYHSVVPLRAVYVAYV